MFYWVLISTGGLLAVVAVLSIILTLLHYPYCVDHWIDVSSDGSLREYYHSAYSEPSVFRGDVPSFEDEEYVRAARAHATAAGIPGLVQSFLKSCKLERGKVLEVGAGSGLLQDLHPAYFALDLSPKAARFFHKPFIEASATALPFDDDTFDGVWSIWVLEHVPNPERALEEIRRVVKHGGHVLLRPAWNCDPWAAEGYEVRPYRDFGLKGKLIKASIPIRLSRWYAMLYSRQVRIIRTLQIVLSGKPSRLRFVRLRPNYSKYWVTDSDAAVALDFYEMYLWFTSRGDECLDCPARGELLFGVPGQRPDSLLVRVNKRQ